jgi:hypothetical protein
MKRLVIILIFLALLTSCSESFKIIDPTKFNEKINSRTDIKTSTDLITLYYDYPKSEGTPTLSITSDKIGGNSYEITLIHEGLEDDSQSGVKIVMKAKLNGQVWSVTEIKKNWKCWDGRGHVTWGTVPCN